MHILIYHYISFIICWYKWIDLGVKIILKLIFYPINNTKGISSHAKIGDMGGGGCQSHVGDISKLIFCCFHIYKDYFF